MNLKTLRDRLLLQEDLNFLLTNRVPRHVATRLVGRLSRIRQPWIAALLIGVWRLFTELDLREAKQQRFASLHECFIRELKAGVRPIEPDPAILCSPCDGIVGACGPVEGTQVFQAKGFPYSAVELFGSQAAAEPYRDGTFITLRLTSAMYHRFHAPADCRIEHVRYLAGDTWNVNPIALKRIERLFCRNERAVLQCRLDGDDSPPVAMVAVAAILVASIRLHCLDELLHIDYSGPTEHACDARYRKGDELGWFQHGSTVIVFAPRGFALAEGIGTGTRVRMGEALLRRAPTSVAATPSSGHSAVTADPEHRG
ncbi:phosphatidylserine decarboxylase [Aquincola sp. S2]|uniref:phosphatidylserine decarboxylase n=1 Tax=Pseudaquabacterium terrae TaxID=2732868 RepID=A0ABX2EJZ5_9BURK|nr:archaetidylserine decarboxylase [Aquabacterium terrae]NRF68906.1 phosphatidylserine decarboxylase [Aquabacterium terrae]